MPNFERMSLKDQLLYIETHMPDAWEYLHDINGAQLPTFDDNDDVVSWRVSCGPQDVKKGGCRDER